LMLVRAPWAWTITKGNPNILVGISDTKFDFSHEELAGKVDYYINLGTSSTKHGTGVANKVAGGTNNSKGISSIGYNTQLAVASGNLINGLLELSNIQGVKVINCSWGYCWTSTYFVELLELVVEEVTSKGILIVASAGNGTDQ